MPRLVGKKIGMTSIFDENRKSIACTLVEVGPCYVTQLKSAETDGYESIQLGYEEKKEKHTTKPEQGHFNKAGVAPQRVVFESDYFIPKAYKKVVEEGVERWEEEQKDALKPGDMIGVELFKPGEFVDVSGKSKGKGFQGVVKRHGFSGVGMRTHGQHNRERAPGSLGAGSTPSRVFKGMRMAGQTGNKKVKTQNLRILKVIPEKNLLVISGAVPGHKGSYIFIEK